MAGASSGSAHSSRLGWAVAFGLFVALIAVIGFAFGSIFGRRTSDHELREAVRAAARNASRANFSYEELERPTPPPVAQPAAPSRPAPVAAAAPTEAQPRGRALPPPVDAGDAGGFVEPLDAGREPIALPDAAPEPVQPAPEQEVAPPPKPCGRHFCPPEQICCNESCGVCSLPGVGCTQRVCDTPFAVMSVICGRNTCNVGQVCCNASCGTCVAAGQTCDTRPCTDPTIQYPVSEVCGMATCNVGYECCNPSCGTCVPLGQACSKSPC